ncbi:MAG: tryptophan--tRNA ligase [Dehalococcoidales bacterium]|nr:MAG: tryptophan--tRNA ligase [Dehalococcoidales bacterium]
MKNRVLTGDRPTGPMHLGHYVGSLENRVKLQREYDCFFIIADYQFLTDHLKETERTEYYINQVLLDWLSVGLSPEKSTFFIQSMIPEIAELTMYFSMLVTVARLQRNPTVKEEFKSTGLRAMSYGFLGYPVSQAADILIVRPNMVPVGDDNLPHVEQTREIARAFNGTFGEVFPVPEAIIGRVARLPGLDGRKMGTSTGNAIFLNDAPEEVKQKVNMAVTDPGRIRNTDKGHPDICNVYKYHLAFNKAEASNIERSCRHGRIGCVACKEKITQRVNAFLEPIREKRAFFEARPSIIREAIKEGNVRARKESRETINLVRKAMNFDYENLLKGEKIAA